VMTNTKTAKSTTTARWPGSRRPSGKGNEKTRQPRAVLPPPTRIEGERRESYHQVGDEPWVGGGGECPKKKTGGFRGTNGADPGM